MNYFFVIFIAQKQQKLKYIFALVFPYKDTSVIVKVVMAPIGRSYVILNNNRAFTGWSKASTQPLQNAIEPKCCDGLRILLASWILGWLRRHRSKRVFPWYLIYHTGRSTPKIAVTDDIREWITRSIVVKMTSTCALFENAFTSSAMICLCLYYRLSTTKRCLEERRHTYNWSKAILLAGCYFYQQRRRCSILSVILQIWWKK